MKAFGSILLYWVKLFTWLPLIFLAILAIKLSLVFGTEGWTILSNMWQIAKTFWELF